MKFLKRLYVKLWLIPLYSNCLKIATGKKVIDSHYELACRFFSYKLYTLKHDNRK